MAAFHEAEKDWNTIETNMARINNLDVDDMIIVLLDMPDDVVDVWENAINSRYNGNFDELDKYWTDLWTEIARAIRVEYDDDDDGDDDE